MLNIAVFVSGGGTNLQAIIDNIEDGTISKARIALVISNKADAYALKRAKKYNIKTKVISKKDFEDRMDYINEQVNILEEYKIDLIVLAGYLSIVPELIIKKYTNQIINIHPSLIPAFSGKGYYGLKVHEEVLKRGCKLTGATVHFVDEGTDTGPIIMQKAIEVKINDTAESLQKRVMEKAEWMILPKTIDLISNNMIDIIDNKVYIKT